MGKGKRISSVVFAVCILSLFAAQTATAGSIVTWGLSDHGLGVVPIGDNWEAVAGGKTHSIALNSDGSLASWGQNDSSNNFVVDGTPGGVGNDNFIAVGAGSGWSIALRSTGVLEAWGYDGDLVVSNWTSSTSPPYVGIGSGYYQALAIRDADRNNDVDWFGGSIWG